MQKQKQRWQQQLSSVMRKSPTTKLQQQQSYQILSQLCNPHSLNIKQLKLSLKEFCSSLKKKQIITQQRNDQIQMMALRPQDYFDSLTEEQMVNLLKWEVIIDFFVSYNQVISEYADLNVSKERNSKNMTTFVEIYNLELKRFVSMPEQFEYNKKSFNNWQVTHNPNDLSLKKRFKYVCFQIFACILNMNLIQRFSFSQEINFDKRLIIGNENKLFYFVDVGEIMERGKFWSEIEKFFMSENQIQDDDGSIIQTNKDILKLFYLGLSIESLQFQSINTSLRFASELLLFIINENEVKNSDSSKEYYQSKLKTKQKQILITVSHLNKIIHYLRVLKRNQHGFSSVYGSQDVASSQNTTPYSSQNGIISKRSILQIQINNDSNVKTENFPSPNFRGMNNGNDENETNFLNLLQDKAEKLIQRLSIKYKDFIIEIEGINSTYEPLGQILMLKNNSSGSDYVSNYSMKKFKMLKFSDDQRKIFFVFMTEQLKTIYRSYQLDWNLSYLNCKKTFLNAQLNKKIQNQLKNQQTKNAKAELMEEFKQNLTLGFDLIAKTNKKIDLKTRNFLQVFPHKIADEKNKSKKSMQNKSNSNIYFPSIKPKINLQVQNRLKLKQIKEDKKVDQSFFANSKKNTLPQPKVTPQKYSLQIGTKIVSKNKIKQQYKPLLEKSSMKNKSTSLPLKIKIDTNYVTKSKFANVKAYENTRSTIMDKKFSYQMILCKRENGRSLDQNNLFFSSEGKHKQVVASQIQQKNPRKSKLRLKSKSGRKQRLLTPQPKHPSTQKDLRLQQENDKDFNSTNLINRLAIEQKKKYEIRRESLLLRSTIDRSKRISGSKRRTSESPQTRKQSEIQGTKPLLLLDSRKSDIKIGAALIQSINLILQNCKHSMKHQDPHKSKLKLDNKISFQKSKALTIQESSKIIEEEDKFENLKFQDAPDTLTTLEIYFRTLIDAKKYQKIVEENYRFYKQIDRLNELQKNRSTFAFRSLLLSLKRIQVFKTKTKQFREKYWNTYRLFFENNDQVITIDVDERQLIFNLNVSFSDYLAKSFSNSFKGQNNAKQNTFPFKMVGDLGGHLDLYDVKLRSLYDSQKSSLKVNQFYKQKLLNKDQTFRFLSPCHHNPSLFQLLGLNKQKNTIDSIELYTTTPYPHFRPRPARIPLFVHQLFFTPLNQYILDWGHNPIPLGQNLYQQLDRTRGKPLTREAKQIYHIYFLNRSYQMHSKFKYLIRRLESRYPSFSYEEYEKCANYFSKDEKEFSESIELTHYLCKNLIVDGKYMLFNVKVLKVMRMGEKGVRRDYLMIEQKNSNYGDHRHIFFVFPLRLRPMKPPTLNSSGYKKSGNKHAISSSTTSRGQQLLKQKHNQALHRYYSLLIHNMHRYHSLHDICDFLIANEMIQINSWTDTMFNKLLLGHPHITVIKKIYQEVKENNDGNATGHVGQEKRAQGGMERQKRVSGLHGKRVSGFGDSGVGDRRAFVYATVKVFIFDKNNLVIGVIELSGQSFFFLLLFEQLNSKTPKYRCKPLSRQFVDKYRSSHSSKKEFRTPKANLSKNTQSHLPSYPHRTSMTKSTTKPTNPFTINKILESEEEFKLSSKKLTKTTPTTKNMLHSSKFQMTLEEEMNNIKQKLTALIKYETEISFSINDQLLSNDQRKRMTIDNYVSKYRVNLRIEGEGVRLIEAKYYWPDIIPQTNRKCISFRLRDDSLMLIKLNKYSSYMRKSNKIKIHYFQNYLQQVSQNKLKFKGNGMNDLVKKQDKYIYYEAYKEFVQVLEKYYYTFSVDQNLLIKVKLGISKHFTYLMNVVDIDIDTLLESNETPHEDKAKLKKIVSFEVRPENLSTFHIENLPLDKKMLNNKRFRKRVHYLIRDQLDGILRKF